jgi:alpha-tubulin suppressor-like RCC1 family protein
MKMLKSEDLRNSSYSAVFSHLTFFAGRRDHGTSSGGERGFSADSGHHSVVGIGSHRGAGRPLVSSFKINNGAVFTANPAVTLPNVCADATSATHSYLASESPDFSGASWQPYMPVPLFVLSGATGTKTVYFKVKNSEGLESAVTSDTITLGSPGSPIMAWGSNADQGCSIPPPNNGFVAMSGGIYHNLGLKADGSIVTWGNRHKVYDRGQFDVPAPNSGFLAVAAGDFHGLGLKTDGSIVAWGDNTRGQCDVPAPNTGFIAIAAGADHSLGLKADGSIVVWGNNEFGQSFVPTPNSGFVAVAAGGGHSLGLKADGSVVAWGKNDSGQCTVPLPGSGFVAVSAGNEHCLGLKADGSVVVWGNNDYGQCVLPEPDSEFMAVAAGYYHNLALKADGSIVAWGMDYDGQCESPVPNSGFTAVAGGEFHSLALVEAGTLQVTLTPPEAVAAGAQWRMTSEPAERWHDSGETLVIRPGADTLTFRKIASWVQPEDQNVAATTGETLLATGVYTKPTSCSLTTACVHGSVEALPSGTLFPFDSTVTLTAQPAPGYWFDHWAGDVPAGLERINPLVLTMDGDKNIEAVVASGPLPLTPVISAFSINQGQAVTVNPMVVLCCACTDETSASAAQYMASESPDFSGAVWQPYRALSLFRLSQGVGEMTVYFTVKNSAGVESAVLSDTIALGGGGLGVVAWGRNNHLFSPISSSQDDYLAISAGNEHGLALKADGAVLAWGNKLYGQGTAPEPNQDFLSVSAGTFHSLALKTDGSILAWGHKGFGQWAVPQPNRDFVAVAAGSITVWA